MQTLSTFTGSSTTSIAANLLNRRFLGIDMEEKFLLMSKARKEEIDTPSKRQEYIKRIEKQTRLFQDKDIRVLEEQSIDYGRHYKIFCVNGNTGFRNESRIFYFIHLQNEEDYERKESSSA